MEQQRIILKSGKDQSLYRYHPWVFSGAIKKTKGNFKEGDVVSVYNNKDEFLGKGHFQPGTIAVRILTFKDVPVDLSFWEYKLTQAYELRKKVGLLNNESTNVFRLINAEGDGMPGLIIDYYNGVAVFQAHSVGMYQLKEQFVEILKKILGNDLRAVYNKSSKTLPYHAPIEKKDFFLFGNQPDKLVVNENNLQFGIDWQTGQKTGFFIDQRDNRNLVRRFSKNANVLNLFGYTGGFSAYAIQGEASKVHTVDSSKKAIELAEENIRLNFNETIVHKGIASDAFEYLKSTKEEYNLIILDPPAFAKHHNVLRNALQGYKKLNRLAFEKIRTNGILFTFSCSQVVSKENFKQMVFAAAASAKRDVKILYHLEQPVDHPISIFHPEGEYLKGLVLNVL